jgi:hypothetical protein
MMLENSEKILCIINKYDREIYIHQTTIENFMKHKPPCQTCLIQGMCIKQYSDHVHNFINMEICDKLREFIHKYERNKQ